MRHTNSKGHSRNMSFNSDHEISTHARPSPAPVNVHRPSRRKDSMQHHHPNPPLTPNTIPSPMPIPNLQPSAPASPPTPAPSPTPHQRTPAFLHGALPEIEDPTLRAAPVLFNRLSPRAKEAWLALIVDSCDNHSLSFLHQLVSPRLKKDPFRTLPNELCFRVGTFLSAPKFEANMGPRF